MTSKRPRISSTTSQRIAIPRRHDGLLPEERRALQSTFLSIARDQHAIDPHDPDALFNLLWDLLAEKYPEPRKRGPQKKWTPVLGVALVADVEGLLAPDDPEKTIVWATRQLAKRERWRSVLWTAGAAEVLRRRYHAFQSYLRRPGSTIAKMMWENYQSDKRAGNLDEWEAEIDEHVRKFREE
jgi:hypothetical protein